MKKVMVFGTFDIIHPGHIYFLKKSKRYGTLYTVVARDHNVMKRKDKPHFDEQARLAKVKKLKISDEVLLGDKENYFDIIKKVNPDIICLGYDQDTMGVEKIFPEIDFIKIDSYKEDKYKTSIIKENLK